jgi:hypothetical protein
MKSRAPSAMLAQWFIAEREPDSQTMKKSRRRRRNGGPPPPFSKFAKERDRRLLTPIDCRRGFSEESLQEVTCKRVATTGFGVSG